MLRPQRLALPATMIFVAACASSGDGEQEQTQQDETPLAWGDLSYRQRKAFMKKVVEPRMARLFTEFDGELYSDFSCKTCHGEESWAAEYLMPTKALPKLDPADEFAVHKADDPQLLEFMMNKVVPTMSDLLGEEQWTHENQEGFGCFECHTKK